MEVSYGGNGDRVEAMPVDFETGSTDAGDLKSLDPTGRVSGVAASAGADASTYVGSDPFTALIG